MDEVNQPFQVPASPIIPNPIIPPTPPNLPPNPPPNETHSSSMIFIVVGIFILILAGLGLYIVAAKNSRPPVQQKTSIVIKPTSTPVPTLTLDLNPVPNATITANWLTYTNVKEGYSLKYKANPNLKQIGCSYTNPGQKGEDLFA